MENETKIGINQREREKEKNRKCVYERKREFCDRIEVANANWKRQKRKQGRTEKSTANIHVKNY